MAHITNGPVDIRITDYNLASALGAVERYIQRGSGFALATLNLDHMVKLRADISFQRAYHRHEIIVADGMPIVWLARLQSKPVQRTAGSDLIGPLFQLAQERRYKVALIGGHDEILTSLKNKLSRDFPTLNIAITHAPSTPFHPTGPEADDLARTLADQKTDLCFCALGAPKQEIFADHARKIARRTGFIGVGAGLDFIAGAQRRAPKWMQVLALEWLWRLTCDPKRMGLRYAKCLAVLPRLFVATLYTASRKPNP